MTGMPISSGEGEDAAVEIAPQSASRALSSPQPLRCCVPHIHPAILSDLDTIIRVHGHLPSACCCTHFPSSLSLELEHLVKNKGQSERDLKELSLPKRAFHAFLSLHSSFTEPFKPETGSDPRFSPLGHFGIHPFITVLSAGNAQDPWSVSSTPAASPS